MSLTDALYSATYNPEAQKALTEQQAKNDAAKKSLEDTINRTKAYRITIGTVTDKANKKMDTMVAQAQAVVDNKSSIEKDYVSQNSSLVAGILGTSNQQVQYSGLNKFTTLFPTQIKIWKGDKLLDDKKALELTNYTSNLLPFMKTADDKSGDELAAKNTVVQKELNALLKGTKVPQFNIFDLDKETLDEKLKAQGAVADQTFDSWKLVSDVWDNTTTFVSYFFYITLGLLGGMLAANDAIGREPKYRVLFFIYGFIFCPFVLIYYLIRFGLGTAPKLYTMLPITQTKAETSLGSFFLFPFYFQEDLKARKKMVDFLTECATLVGKTFDPSTLPPLPEATTSLAHNIGAAMRASLPNLSTIRVHKGDFFPSVKSVQLEPVRHSDV